MVRRTGSRDGGQFQALNVPEVKDRDATGATTNTVLRATQRFEVKVPEAKDRDVLEPCPTTTTTLSARNYTKNLHRVSEPVRKRIKTLSSCDIQHIS